MYTFHELEINLANERLCGACVYVRVCVYVCFPTKSALVEFITDDKSNRNEREQTGKQQLLVRTELLMN